MCWYFFVNVCCHFWKKSIKVFSMICPFIRTAGVERSGRCLKKQLKTTNAETISQFAIINFLEIAWNFWKLSFKFAKKFKNPKIKNIIIGSGPVPTDQDISGHHRHLYVGFHLPGKRHKEAKDSSKDKGGEPQKNGSVRQRIVAMSSLSCTQLHAPPRDMLIHVGEKNFEISVKLKMLMSSSLPRILGCHLFNSS